MGTSLGARPAASAAAPAFDPYRRLPFLVFDLLREVDPEAVRARFARSLELLVPGARVTVDPGDERCVARALLSRRPGAPPAAAVRGSASERFLLEQGRGVGSCLVVPLAAHGVAVGEARIEQEGTDGFSSVQVDGVLAFSEIAALALLNAHAHTALERLAWTDELSGLPNRRRLLTEISDRLARAEPVAVLFLDFDGLREVNNELGYEAGDELVRAVAARAAAHVAPEDLVGRLGGDEFVAVVRCEGAAEALGRARALELALGEIDAPAEIQARYLGTSVGAVAAEPGDGPDDVLRRAGLRMRERKAERRAERI